MTGGWVAPCIDTLTFIYCVASHPVQSASAGNNVTVSDDNGVRTDATFSDNNDYEGQGSIATIQLLTPSSGPLVVSCSGKLDSSGTLIENPVEIINDLIDTTSVSVDATTYANAKRTATEEGYVAAGVIVVENSFAFWITQIMGSFLGDWWQNNQGKLKLSFGTDSIGGLQMAGFLVERRTTQVTGTLTAKNIVNQAIIYAQLSSEKQDRRYKEGTLNNYLYYDNGEASKDLSSQNKYGIRKRIFELDWVQNSGVAQDIQERIIDRFSGRTWIITWQEYDYLNMQVEEGDYVTYSWEERRDANGDPLVNQIAQVLSKDIDLDNERMTFTLKDLGSPLSGFPDIWDGTQYTGDGGTFGGDRELRKLW